MSTWMEILRAGEGDSGCAVAAPAQTPLVVQAPTGSANGSELINHKAECSQHPGGVWVMRD